MASRRKVDDGDAQGRKRAKTAVIYLRISQDPYDTQAGVDRQREDCERICKRHGLMVLDTKSDNNRSASRYARRRRDGWAEVMEMVKAGTVGAVVAYDLDRMLRQMRDLEDLIDEAEKGLVVLSAQGEIDLNTDNGRFVARVLVAKAAKEAEDASRRSRRMHEDRAVKGRKHGSPPYGYRLVDASPMEKKAADGSQRTVMVGGRWEIADDEAKVLRELAGRVLSGESATSLAIELNTRGVATARGRVWTATTIRSALTNMSVAGLRTHHGEEVATAEWAAILDRRSWTRLVGMFDARKGTGAHAKRISLLTSGLRCACGAVMVRDAARGRTVMRCKPAPGRPGCGHNTAPSDELELAVTEMLFARLDKADLRTRAGKARKGADERKDREVSDLSAQLDELAEMFARREISRREWLVARRAVDDQKRAAEAELARAAQATSLPVYAVGKGRLREQWPTLSLDQQRSVLWAVLDHVVVAPSEVRGEAFRTSRLSPIWLV